MPKKKFPEEVIAITSKKRREVRLLVERGQYVKYTYLDEKTGKLVKKGKESVFLKPKGAKGKALEQLFLIPLSGARNFMIRERKPPGKVWNTKRKKAEEMF